MIRGLVQGWAHFEHPFSKERILILKRFRSADPMDVMDKSQCNDGCDLAGVKYNV